MSFFRTTSKPVKVLFHQNLHLTRPNKNYNELIFSLKMKSISSNSHATEFQNKPVFKNNNKPESESSPISLSSSSSFCKHLQQFPILFKIQKIVSLSRLFLSRSRIFYFSSNNVFRIDFKIVPEAKFFLKMRNAFLLFYLKSEKKGSFSQLSEDFLIRAKRLFFLGDSYE